MEHLESFHYLEFYKYVILCLWEQILYCSRNHGETCKLTLTLSFNSGYLLFNLTQGNQIPFLFPLRYTLRSQTFFVNRKPFKNNKKILFLWPSKFTSFSRYLRFCPDFYLMHKQGLIRKIRLIPKFMGS